MQGGCISANNHAVVIFLLLPNKKFRHASYLAKLDLCFYDKAYNLSLKIKKIKILWLNVCYFKKNNTFVINCRLHVFNRCIRE